MKKLFTTFCLFSLLLSGCSITSIENENEVVETPEEMIEEVVEVPVEDEANEEENFEEYFSQDDERILLTNENADQYQFEDCLNYETNTDTPSTAFIYEDKGISFSIPYNPNWGNDEFRINPYDVVDDSIKFGIINYGGMEGDCGWYRDYSFSFEPAQTAADLIEEVESGEYLFDIEPVVLDIDGLEVVQYEIEGMCGEGAYVVIGEGDYNYKFRGVCKTTEYDFEYLKTLIEFVELI